MPPVTSPPPKTPAGEDPTREPPSKSERKRTAHAAQDLGEALIGIRDAELDALGLPEPLLEAVRAARNIRSRAGGARQRQYIGKLMRTIDPEPIRRALAARSEQDIEETQKFKRAEAWRQRLLAQGPTALDELVRLRPDLDRTRFTQLIEAARHAAGTAGAAHGRGGSGRELFRALRALLG